MKPLLLLLAIMLAIVLAAPCPAMAQKRKPPDASAPVALQVLPEANFKVAKGKKLYYGKSYVNVDELMRCKTQAEADALVKAGKCGVLNEGDRISVRETYKLFPSPRAPNGVEFWVLKQGAQIHKGWTPQSLFTTEYLEAE